MRCSAPAEGVRKKYSVKSSKSGVPALSRCGVISFLEDGLIHSF